MRDRPSDDVSIRAYGPDDLPLLRALLGDPAMTVHLGGPESETQLLARHERYLAADPETNGLFTVVLGEAETPVGWVGFWEAEWAGQTQWECGWHVLVGHQRKGVATQAVRLVLAEARSRDRHRFVDAFPSADNDASNALCARVGFRFLGMEDVEYPKGRWMRSHHWRLDLRDAFSG